MEHSESNDHRRRTFQQILDEEYHGSIAEFCRENGLQKQYRWLHAFMNGHVSLAMLPAFPEIVEKLWVRMLLSETSHLSCPQKQILKQWLEHAHLPTHRRIPAMAALRNTTHRAINSSLSTLFKRCRKTVFPSVREAYEALSSAPENGCSHWNSTS